jgi:hypothetical protein
MSMCVWNWTPGGHIKHLLSITILSLDCSGICFISYLSNSNDLHNIPLRWFYPLGTINHDYSLDCPKTGAVIFSIDVTAFVFFGGRKLL